MAGRISSRMRALRRKKRISDEVDATLPGLEKQEVTYGLKALVAFSLVALLMATQLPHEWLHHASQAWMLVFSCLSIRFAALMDSRQKWGFVFGLLSEPGYLYMVFETPDLQWGILLLTAWWSWYWTAGAIRRFRKSET